MEPITVKSVEFYAKQNSKDNYTEQYDLVNNPDTPCPIFRRGCNFFFGIRFNRIYNVENDIIRLMFSFGKSNECI